MVNGTTYAKKIEVEHKKRKQKYRYKNKKSTINILYTRYIEYIVLLINEQIYRWKEKVVRLYMYIS